jgi:ubiquinone/menaquinone biosynthesis C-methylase UbiE
MKTANEDSPGASSEAGDATHKHAGWKAQFGHPTGLMGRLVGRLMASKNAYMHRLAADVLDVQTDDRILEIGFGSGTLIQELARRATAGFVAGVDPSDVMVQQAAGRNLKWIRSGRVVLERGGVSKLPFPDGRFTKVCEVNSFHHWPDPARDLQEVQRVLQKGGLLLLCLRMKSPTPGRFQAPGHDEEGVRRVGRIVKDAGFSDVRTERRQLAREVVCVLARH